MRLKSVSPTIPNTAPISDRVLWLGSGESAAQARVTLYSYGEQFEVYTSVAGEVPKRRIGSLGTCIEYGQRFIDSLLSQGWTLDMQAEYPAIPGDTLSIG